MNQSIAHITILAIPPNKLPFEAVIGVAAPSLHKEHDFSCEVSMPDREKPYEIFGVDTFQSLSLAMRFIAARIDHLTSQGWQFQGLHEGEAYEMDWSSYFMPQSVLDKLEAIGNKAIDELDANI